MSFLLDRRRFLTVTATAAGGLLLGFRPQAAVGDQEPASFQPDLFIRIDPDGAVTLTIPRPEMGQGVRTSLALVLAEELDADWSRVQVVSPVYDPDLGEQYSGGSSSVSNDWERLRRAGATARQLLLAAAAERWGIAAASCATEPGVVVHPDGEQRAPYGTLTGAAARLTPPDEVALKAAGDFRLVGGRVPSVDASAIVRGAITFGLDARVPGQRFAVIERAPVFGARPRHVDDRGALQSPGVRQVVTLDADSLPDIGSNNPRPVNGVAVIADSTWQAMQGRKALRVEWEGGASEESSGAQRRRAHRLLERPPERIKHQTGDPDTAFAAASSTVEAVYDLPLQTHAPMEPMNCLADTGEGRCRIWAPTQNPEDLRTTVATVLGLTPERVVVHPVRMGGAFGRRYYSDYAVEAALLSREARAPVQVVWTREDDTRHGFYRPAAVHRLRAALDASGRITAWSHGIVNASRGEFLRWRLPPEMKVFPPAADLYPFDFPAGLVPAFRVEGSALRSPTPLGQWRSIEESTNVFAVQSFVDEVAHRAGRDPLELRLRLLGESRELPYTPDGTYTWSTGRLAGVLRLAAEKAGWGKPLPPGHGRGIAGAYCNGSYVGEVAEVEVAADGALRVHRVVAAVDCGQVVHRSGLEAQVEGSIVYGLSAALYDEITVEDGRVMQGNFDDYRIPRLDDTPHIEVHTVPGGGEPLGMGEPALPPIAPAVANALFAATGLRVRRLPIRPEELREEVSAPG